MPPFPAEETRPGSSAGVSAGEYELFRHARHIEEILGWDPAPVDPVE